mgnify:CR=1 FL=1
MKSTDFYSNKNTVGGRRGAGFKAEDKSFGSLLGLSYYLDSDSFRGLLRSISDLWSDGSAICFDYQTMDGSGETRRNEQLAGAAGEGMKAKYTAAEIEQMLADCGFLIYEQLDDEEMTKRYFAPCRDDMRAPKGVNYILAVKSAEKQPRFLLKPWLFQNHLLTPAFSFSTGTRSGRRRPRRCIPR